MKQTDFKTCRYSKCAHESKKIDIAMEPFCRNGNAYYHEDCYAAKHNDILRSVASTEKSAEVKADIQYIRQQWEKHISDTVVYSQLYQCLNRLLETGCSSKYLVFVMDYVVRHKLNLRYPYGFRYFVDDPKIKDAYKKACSVKTKSADFAFLTDGRDDAPKFATNPTPQGFDRVLGGGKK